MSESFAELFEESLATVEMVPGSIVIGTIVDIDNEWVVVHAGLKSEGVIPRNQFVNESGEFSVEIGDQVKVAMEVVDDGFGETRLSREKARRAESWDMLEDAFNDNEPVIGIMNGKVKGGFTVDINEIRAFLPGSLVDIRPLRETIHLEGKPLEFKVIKLDQKRNNVVVSRRAVLEQENSEERDALLDSLEEGQEVNGVVKNLTDYGAFVDLGGIDGLLHITDMAWRRIRHPSEMVNVGDELPVKILKFDREKNRVSLGMKQLGDDPWVEIKGRYPENTRVQAVVTNLTDYGCFAEIEEGVEGLVHVSEMDWTNKNIHPSKVVGVGDEVEVMVLDIDEERRRISLGIKQCRENPWGEFGSKNAAGDRISGKIKSITDFGYSLVLKAVLTDWCIYLISLGMKMERLPFVAIVREKSSKRLSWQSIPSENVFRSVLSSLRRIRFLTSFRSMIGGSIVHATVSEVEEKYAVLTLAEGVEGVLKASEISIETVVDARQSLSIGDELEVKISGLDRKNRTITLSAKSREIDDEQEAHREYQEQDDARAGTATLGDLIKAQMDSDDDNDGSEEESSTQDK
ncbi:MAG: 30S ribosomal protein S1 [Gammaproteobacteria bacterium]|nr:MAG: 30S ribosomal protein S1 [Gammaproteobacteria bacterium]